MLRIMILGVLACLALIGFASRGNAQTVPSVKGLKAHTVQTNYMSLVGYLRWQYYVENKQWISLNEAYQLVNEQ